MLALAYEHPRTGKPVRIRQAVRIARDQPFELRVGQRGEIICWGVMPTGCCGIRCSGGGSQAQATHRELP